MAGAAGSFYSRTKNDNLGGYLTLFVNWRQVLTEKPNRSIIEIEARIVRESKGGDAGGTWYAGSSGGIKVNGAMVCGWTKNQSARWTKPGSTGWSGKGSVEITHNDTDTVAISISSVRWNNTTYSNSTFTIPSKTETVLLMAIPPRRSLSVDVGVGAHVTIERVSSWVGGPGQLYPGDKLWHNDVLRISFSADENYRIDKHTVNGINFVSGNTYKVSNNVAVVVTAYLMASDVGATDANIGSKSTITVTKHNSNFYHSLQYSFGDISGYITSSGDVQSTEIRFANESVSFTVPDSFYEQIPNARTGKCTITCRTYEVRNQNVLGEPTTCVFTVTATGSPSVSGVVVDTDPITTVLTGNPSILIRYRSDPKCTITAAPQNAASISSMNIRSDDVVGTAEASGVVTGEKTYRDASYTSFSFRATDSRGYSSLTTIIPTVVNYIDLTCSPVISRPTPTGSDIIMSASGTLYRGSFGATSNTLTLEYRYKTTDGSYSSWITVPSHNIVLGSSKYTVTDFTLGEDFDYKSGYVFQVRARDGATVDGVNYTLSTVTKTIEVQKGIPVFDWGENDFNVNVELMLKNINIVDIIYPVGAVYMHSSDTLPIAVSGVGAWDSVATGIDGVYAWKRTA